MALVGRYHNNHRCRLSLRRMEGEPRDRDPAADIVSMPRRVRWTDPVPSRT